MTDLPGFVAQCRQAPEALRTGQKRALRTSTFGMARAARAATTAAAPGGRVNVGRKGARIGVRAQVTADGMRGYVNASGPYQLIERDTAPHTEPRARRRGKRKTLLIPGIGYRRTVHHPGTHGKHPFKTGIEAYTPEVSRIFERELHRAMQRTFR